MNLTTVAITFGLIFVAELPDKTMIAAIVLSSRYRPLPVWAGAALAMVFNAGVAVAAGRLLALLPHRAVEGVVAAFFAAAALYLVLVNERTEEREGAGQADGARTSRRVAMGAFAVIVVAELGDVTQVLTANLAAKYHDPLSVFVGSAAAMVIVMALGVAGGRALLRMLPLATIRRAAGVVLAGFALYTLVTAVTP